MSFSGVFYHSGAGLEIESVLSEELAGLVQEIDAGQIVTEWQEASSASYILVPARERGTLAQISGKALSDPDCNTHWWQDILFVTAAA